MYVRATGKGSSFTFASNLQPSSSGEKGFTCALHYKVSQDAVLSLEEYQNVILTSSSSGSGWEFRISSRGLTAMVTFGGAHMDLSHHILDESHLTGWHSIVLSMDPTDTNLAEFWFDGKMTENMIMPAQYTAGHHNSTAGACPAHGRDRNCFVGELKGIVISSRVLTHAEIATHYLSA